MLMQSIGVEGGEAARDIDYPKTEVIFMSKRTIDLSLPFHDGMEDFSREQAAVIERDDCNTTNLFIYSHAGTHMDAPLHFVAGGHPIDQWDLSCCMGDALVVDLTHKAPDSFITPDDLKDYADQINHETRLLLRTDWDKHANMPDYRTHFPRISVELARWLADRQIILLGLETPSVASLRPENRQELIDVHQILLKAGIIIVESLANLRDLQQQRIQFIALPLKIEGCDGSPVRAVGVEDIL